ncbi:uncharacterized protein, partial [Notothenia coriiceps]|uniref:Tyr recombinase domain-containing protein n=1 Tax=Notothenia coriiceps TaxID=8208 RepID=A0A6I9NGA3_9TELE
MRNGTAPLATPDFSSTGRIDGDCPFTEGGHHGRMSDRLGRYLRGSPGEGSLEQRPPAVAHKLPGAFSGVPHPRTLSAFSQRTPCPREDGQYDHNIVYKPTRGFALSPVTHAGTQTDLVELRPSPLSESDARTRVIEPRGRLTVQRCTTICRLDSTSNDCEPAVGALRPSRGRSVGIKRKCSLSAFLFNARSKRTVRCGRARAQLASGPPVRVPTPGADTPNSGQSEGTAPRNGPDSSALACNVLAVGDLSVAVRSAVAAPPAQRHTVSGGGDDLSPTPGAHGPMDLAREWYNMSTVGLPQKVINTIQSARASSTRSLYDFKWRVFEEWCLQKGHTSFQCPVGVILSFLQDLIEKHRAFSTIKVYLVAIAECHVGFEGKTASQHPLVCRFMKGARRLLPVSRSLVPLWDLTVVLDGLTRTPFEPLEEADMKHLSLKTVLLLALASAKRVSDIHALSVHPSCTQFFPGQTRVLLKPNPAFIPKVVGSCTSIDIVAFPPPLCPSGEQQPNLLCPVRALRTYMDRSKEFRRNDQLFVSWANPHKGKPVTKQRLSHWIVEAIALAYTSQGLQAPPGLRAHSTRGLATSWALFKGVSIQDICAAASWSSPLTFVRFYRLDVSAPSVAHAV